MRATLPSALLLLLPACVAPRGPGRFPGPDLTELQPHPIVAPGVPGIPGFSAAVKVGNVVYLSGQVPLDSAGALVAPDDLAAQSRQAFANVARVIRAARGVPGDLVQLTVYLSAYDTAAVGTIRAAAQPYFEPGVPPALTVVGIGTLPEPRMRIVVSGIAVLRGQLPDRTRDHGP
jgi:enamine deaminase RidA (YjgF/YER057c/UK114 family)